MIRDYKIFRSGEVNQICLQSIGITVEDIFLIGLALIGVFTRNPRNVYPVKVNLQSVDHDKIERFLQITSCTDW